MSETRSVRSGLAEDSGVVGDRLGPQSTATTPPSRPADLGAVTDEIKGAASDVAGAAVEQGRALYESAKGVATSFADERKNAAAQSVSDLAASLRNTGGTFGERPNIQAFVGSAADGLEQLASSIQERSFAELFAEAEAYARRSPVTVGAAAAVAGFLLARFIKSSAEELSEAGHASRPGARAGGRATARRTAAASSYDV